MDVIAAYQLVGTYRGAAAMCGTTHKTVKCIIERAEAGGKPPVRGPGNTITTWWLCWSPTGSRPRRAGFQRSGCCRLRKPPGMAGRPVTSGGWSPR